MEVTARTSEELTEEMRAEVIRLSDKALKAQIAEIQTTAGKIERFLQSRENIVCEGLEGTYRSPFTIMDLREFTGVCQATARLALSDWVKAGKGLKCNPNMYDGSFNRGYYYVPKKALPMWGDVELLDQLARERPKDQNTEKRRRRFFDWALNVAEAWMYKYYTPSSENYDDEQLNKIRHVCWEILMFSSRQN